MGNMGNMRNIGVIKYHVHPDVGTADHPFPISRLRFPVSVVLSPQTATQLKFPAPQALSFLRDLSDKQQPLSTICRSLYNNPDTLLQIAGYIQSGYRCYSLQQTKEMSCYCGNQQICVWPFPFLLSVRKIPLINVTVYSLMHELKFFDIIGIFGCLYLNSDLIRFYFSVWVSNIKPPGLIK